MVLIVVMSFTRYLVCSNNDSGVIYFVYFSLTIYLLSTVTHKGNIILENMIWRRGLVVQEKYLDSTLTVIYAYLSLS